MSGLKDPVIKLFGQTIHVPGIPAADAAADSECDGDVSGQSYEVSGYGSLVQDRSRSVNSFPEESNLESGGPTHGEDSGKGRADDVKVEDDTEMVVAEEQADSSVTSKAPTVGTEADPATASKADDGHYEENNSQDKTLKKPDKILPCPRCNSMDTKFCYYNNYNVNQPRHFCKNCQRYWTAGGNMRNVPVGAGRRKTKSSASQCRQKPVPETVHSSRGDIPNGLHQQKLTPKGTVITFGSDSPLCESMASVLNIAEKAVHNCTRSGFHRPEELKIAIPNGSGGNGNDHLNGASVSGSTSKEEAGKDVMPDKQIPNCQSIPPQMPCFPGASWPYAWNPVRWRSPITPAAFCPPGFPMPFYTAATYWGSTVPGAWSVPWTHPQFPPQNLNSPTSGPDSPTLGKHARDDNKLKPGDNKNGDVPKESNPEKRLWVPKTLRIDDPREAAKSSILATLGIKNDKVDSAYGGGGGLFKAFQAKDDEKANVSETSSVLQANPAALSRSVSFREASQVNR